jgi:hypothetical protein
MFILLAQNEMDIADFSEQRCGTSVEMKTAIGIRFQPTLKGAAKKLSRVVGKLDRIADTLFASLLTAELFVARKIGIINGS